MTPPQATLPEDLGLFGSNQGEPVPEDIVNAMRILSGGMQINSDGDIVPEGGDPLDLEKAKPPANAQERWQGTMLKKHELKQARGAFTDFEVRAFDLSDSADAGEFSRILNEAGAVGSNRMIEQTEPVTLIDSNAPRGFRSVVVVKFFRTQKQMPPTENSPRYEVPPQLARGER